ncbi:MAG: tRNA pseudouridine(38-40) synthase TruA, partial [Devosia sp.]
MPRYVLVIEYDGTPFVGWQRQAGALSVQQVVEEAIARMSGETVTVQAA